ncbi:hypothetical protein PIB30_077591, partial [Stylosanthes scabra]|nr:hypothetical protein [Stylosanthes scabra]
MTQWSTFSLLSNGAVEHWVNGKPPHAFFNGEGGCGGFGSVVGVCGWRRQRLEKREVVRLRDGRMRKEALCSLDIERY